MCGMSGFFEQFFPLVCAINQKLPPAHRLRVLDPPIDWQQVKSAADVRKFGSRNPTIASVMEKEVLAKHHKALMLFGTFHLFHTSAGSAVAAYEKDYPGLTFVISDLDTFDIELPASWPIPSLVSAKGTWMVHWIWGTSTQRRFPWTRSVEYTISFRRSCRNPWQNLWMPSCTFTLGDWH
jgi:hypothetical protein